MMFSNDASKHHYSTKFAKADVKVAELTGGVGGGGAFLMRVVKRSGRQTSLTAIGRRFCLSLAAFVNSIR